MRRGVRGQAGDGTAQMNESMDSAGRGEGRVGGEVDAWSW